VSTPAARPTQSCLPDCGSGSGTARSPGRWQNDVFSCGRLFLVDAECQSAAIVMVFAPLRTTLFVHKKPSILIICLFAASSLGRSGLVSYAAAVGTKK
jgi:hypothetical protein